MAELYEECGLAAVVLKKDLAEYPERDGAANYLYTMLIHLQHRGQLSAGIATYNENERAKLKRYRQVGEVKEVFKKSNPSRFREILEYNDGTRGIGHVRYATAIGAREYLDVLNKAQPFLRDHPKPWKKFAIAFNGNLANYNDLKSELETEYGYEIETDVDTELIFDFLMLNLKIEAERIGCKPNVIEVFKSIYEKFEGACNTVTLFGDGDLIAIRDKYGFKPLCWGENDFLYAIASESVALTKIGIPYSRIFSVEPGEAILIENGHTSKIMRAKIAHSDRRALDMFELVYFAHPSSVIDGILVKDVRRRLGQELAKIEPLKAKLEDESLKEDYVIVPVPNTSIPIAAAMAEALHVERRDTIIKNEYIGRTFIERKMKNRLMVKEKYSITPQELENKKVIVVEDSLVRGNTARELVDHLRDREIGGAAAEVHLRLGCPPIFFPCWEGGLDFPTFEELGAARFNSVEEAEHMLAKETHADSLKYQTIEGLVRAIGLPESELCLACLTGNYVTKAGQELYQRELRKYQELS